MNGVIISPVSSSINLVENGGKPFSTSLIIKEVTSR